MIQIVEQQNILFLAGDLNVHTVKTVWDYFETCFKQKKSFSAINLSAIATVDSAGVTLLDELLSKFPSIQYINTPFFLQQAISNFSTANLPPEKVEEVPGILESLGEKAIQFKIKFMDLLYLTADIFYWSFSGIFHKKGQREGSFVQQCLLIGVNALPIVGLISFLIGLILALQSAAQLRQFGANIFVADLIGIAMLREMGPIMTAIVVAGRSGSAIASEIATMVVTADLAALKTMALNPIRFVMVPKFHAILVTMPLLTILADLIGIFGGFIIGVTYLQLSPQAFVNELMTVLILKDVFTGLFKSFIFAGIIVIVGCYQGLHVTGGSEGVGRVTTASVVASIFFVIVADSIMGLIFYFN